MTFTATSRPVFRCFPGQGVGEVGDKGNRTFQYWHENHPHNTETYPALGKGGWMAIKMALRYPPRRDVRGRGPGSKGGTKEPKDRAPRRGLYYMENQTYNQSESKL